MKTPFPFKQGEHVFISGTTGSGKSTLASKVLIPARSHTLVMRSKPDEVVYEGHKVVRTAQTIDRDVNADRFVLSPRYGDAEEQAKQFRDALDYVWRHGAWTLYLDEVFYLHRLGLMRAIEILYTQGRSKKITVIGGAQRPLQLSRFIVSESTHVISFGLDGRDAKELGKASSERLENAVQSLARYEFAWYYRPDRAVWTGRIQDLGVDIAGR